MVKIEVRFNECDETGYAFYGNFFIWNGVAGAHFFKNAGVDLADYFGPGKIFVQVHQSCDYKRPVTFMDVVEIRTTLKNLGESSIHLQFDLFKNDELVAVGNGVTVCMDQTTGEKSTLPEDLREKLSPLVGVKL